MESRYLVCRLKGEWHMLPEGSFSLKKTNRGIYITPKAEPSQFVEESDYALHSFTHALAMLGDAKVTRIDEPEFPMLKSMDM